MGTYFTLFIGAVLINNFVLTKFLGLCIFFGVSKNLNASIGMGFAVTSVITLSTLLAWLLYNYILVPFGLTFLRTISFVVLIASFVQLLEIVIKKMSPTLYNMVNLERSGDVEEFRAKVIQFPQVLECHHVVGAFDYLLKVLVRTPDELENFLMIVTRGCIIPSYNGESFLFIIA